MPHYGDVEFFVYADEKEGTISRPLLVPEDWGVVRTKIPYSDTEQIQFTGRGNPRLKLRCVLYSDADFQTLLGMVGTGMPVTLVDPLGDGVDYDNMLLCELSDVWRVSFVEEINFTAVWELVVI